MKWLAFGAVVLLIVAGLAGELPGKRWARSKTRDKSIRRRLLGSREEAMFNRLSKAFPESIVFAQVGLSSLLDASSRAERKTLDKKVADFVLCTRAFDVIAIIELADATGVGRLIHDARLTSMLTRSGYAVSRYTEIPDIDQLWADFNTWSQASRNQGS